MFHLPICLTKFFKKANAKESQPLPKIPVLGHFSLPETQEEWWKVTPEPAPEYVDIPKRDLVTVQLIETAMKTGHRYRIVLPEAHRQCMLYCLKQGDYVDSLRQLRQSSPSLFSSHEQMLLDTLSLPRQSVTEADGAVPPDSSDPKRQKMQQELLVSLAREIVRQLYAAAPADNNEAIPMLLEHTLASSLAMESLCESFSVRLRTFPILLALLNDIGKAVVLWTSVEVTGKIPGLSARTHLFHKFERDVACDVIADWGMPRALQQIVAQPVEGQIPADDRLGVWKALVQVADSIAQRCGHGSLEIHKSIIQLPGAHRLGITLQNADRILHDMPTRLLKSIA